MGIRAMLGSDALLRGFSMGFIMVGFEVRLVLKWKSLTQFPSAPNSI
jgi:hypothetical protein